MPQPPKPYKLSNEMQWKADPNVDAARRLPHWRRFHELCSHKKLFFDNPVQDGRGGAYSIVAFTTEKTPQGGWSAYEAGKGTGKSVVEALQSAFKATGYDIPEAAGLLSIGLEAERDYAGEKMAPGHLRDHPASYVAEDEFDTLAAPVPAEEIDEFSELLG